MFKNYKISLLLSSILLSHEVRASDTLLRSPKVQYFEEKNLVIADQSEVLTGKYYIKADKISYFPDRKLLLLNNNVFIDDTKNQFVCKNALIDTKYNFGILDQMSMRFKGGAIFAANSANKVSEDKYVVSNSLYTACKVCKYRAPIWQVRAKTTTLDREKQRVTYQNAYFDIFGMPVFYTPYFAHPTPDAKAQSGILVPNIHNGSVRVPLYLRLADNLDATITPRFLKSNDNIIEQQIRYLNSYGSINIDSSFGKISKKTKDQNKQTITSKKHNRFHLFSRGDFNHNNINYGFNLNRTSDKSYLKNYDYYGGNYLHSDIYAKSYSQDSFYSMNVMKFQGLSNNDSKDTDPNITPAINTMNNFYLSEDKSTSLLVRTNTSHYFRQDGVRSTRFVLENQLAKDLYLASGTKLGAATYLRSDIYKQQYLSKALPNKKNSASIARIMPELHVKAEHPFKVSYNNKHLDHYVNPSIKFIKTKSSIKELPVNTDSVNLELNDINIYNSNRFAGLDNHEIGDRAIYGTNFYKYIDDVTLDAFLGGIKFLNHKTSKNRYAITSNDKHTHYVGRLNMSRYKAFDLYYNFSTPHNNFKEFRNELGIKTYHSKQLQTNIYYSYLPRDKDFQLRKFSQLTSKIKFKATENLDLTNDSRFDLSPEAKRSLLSTIFGVTYTQDCVSIRLAYGRDYTSDPIRGIKRGSKFSAAIKFKTLNW